jgi:hypothetical protein
MATMELFTPLNARPMECGVYSIGAKPIYLGYATRVREDNVFWHGPFIGLFLKRTILTLKLAV